MAKREVVSDFHEPKLVQASPDTAKPDAGSEAKKEDSSLETPKPESTGTNDEE